MNTQPKALWLADELESTCPNFGTKQAAAELRRLHEVNQMLVESAEMALEALKDEKDFRPNEKCNKAIQAIRQAIAKAKEKA